MSATANPLHAMIDAVDERTFEHRQRCCDPSTRRQVLEQILKARDAVLHNDVEYVQYLCKWIERKVRDQRMWRVAAWLNDGNDENHPRIAAWFLTTKMMRERELECDGA